MNLTPFFGCQQMNLTPFLGIVSAEVAGLRRSGRAGAEKVEYDPCFDPCFRVISARLCSAWAGLR